MCLVREGDSFKNVDILLRGGELEAVIRNVSFPVGSELSSTIQIMTTIALYNV